MQPGRGWKKERKAEDREEGEEEVQEFCLWIADDFWVCLLFISLLPKFSISLRFLNVYNVCRIHLCLALFPQLCLVLRDFSEVCLVQKLFFFFPRKSLVLFLFNLIKLSQHSQLSSWSHTHPQKFLKDSHFPATVTHCIVPKSIS